jgi:SpoVK/Ycf46/Vps4 family AAA+-type ATPase
MNALRINQNTKAITMDDFKKALERTGPSITQDMEKWYQNMMKQFRTISKPDLRAVA